MARIIDSCGLSRKMITAKGTETRVFIKGTQSKWDEVAKHCIKNKLYLIVTPCINRNDGSVHYPGDSEWVSFIKDICSKLRSWGMNRYNGRLSLINEPMKFCTREQYEHLINLAYPIIKSYGFLCGAGNEEFLTAHYVGNRMYEYLLEQRRKGLCKFDILDIHIQGSCMDEEDCKYWTDVAYSWSKTYNIPLACTEAFYGDIATARGWEILQFQYYHAERIGCLDFGNVFNDIDTGMFPFDVSKWHKLCFKINGKLRKGAEAFWKKWKAMIDTRGPVPNIKEIVRDGMIIKTIGFKDTDMKDGYPVLFANELLYKNNFLNFSDVGYSYTDKTKQATIDFINHVREKYPTDPVKQKLKSDGRIGRQTFRYLIEELLEKEEREKYFNAFEIMTSPYNLDGDT